MTNSLVKEHILDTMSGILPGEKISQLMRRFEELKWNWDFTESSGDGGPMNLHGDHVSVTIPTDVYRNAYQKAHKPGLAVFEQQMDTLIQLSRSFCIIFCGGSYRNAGLRAPSGN